MRRLAAVAKIVVVLFAINFVAITVVALMMMAKGMLTRERLAAVASALKGPPAGLETLAEDGTAAHPAARPLPPPPLSLADRRRAVALVRTDLDREIEEIRQRSQAVERERQRLEKDRADLEAARKTFLESMDAVAQAKREAGKKQLLKTLAALKAPRIKILLEKQTDEYIAEILVGLEPRLRGKVIDEFKAAEELERIRRVLDLIRQGAGSKPPAKMASL